MSKRLKRAQWMLKMHPLRVARGILICLSTPLIRRFYKKIQEGKRRAVSLWRGGEESHCEQLQGGELSLNIDGNGGK